MLGDPFLRKKKRGKKKIHQASVNSGSLVDAEVPSLLLLLWGCWDDRCCDCGAHCGVTGIQPEASCELGTHFQQG